MQRAGLMQGLHVPNTNTKTWRPVMYEILLEEYWEITGGVPAGRRVSMTVVASQHCHDFAVTFMNSPFLTSFFLVVFAGRAWKYTSYN